MYISIYIYTTFSSTCARCVEFSNLGAGLSKAGVFWISEAGSQTGKTFIRPKPFELLFWLCPRGFIGGGHTTVREPTETPSLELAVEGMSCFVCSSGLCCCRLFCCAVLLLCCSAFAVLLLSLLLCWFVCSVSFVRLLFLSSQSCSCWLHFFLIVKSRFQWWVFEAPLSHPLVSMWPERWWVLMGRPFSLLHAALTL